MKNYKSLTNTENTRLNTLIKLAYVSPLSFSETHEYLSLCQKAHCKPVYAA